MKELSQDFINTAKVVEKSELITTYELDAETLVETYDYDISIQEIEQEKTNAKNAVRMGIPTTFSFDVVRIGNGYGIIYENVQSETLGTLVTENPDKFDEYVTDFTNLNKKMHSTHVGYDAFRSAKGMFEGYGEQLVSRNIFTREEVGMVKKMLDAIPDQDTFLISIPRTSYMRYFDDELTVYGLRDAGYGHPIYDLSGTCLSMFTTAQDGDDDKCRFSTGMDCATTIRFYKAYIRQYFGCKTDEDAAAMEARVQFAALLRHYTVPIIYQLASDQVIQMTQDVCRNNFFPHIDQWIADMKDVWERFL